MIELIYAYSLNSSKIKDKKQVNCGWEKNEWSDRRNWVESNDKKTCMIFQLILEIYVYSQK